MVIKKKAGLPSFKLPAVHRAQPITNGSKCSTIPVLLPLRLHGKEAKQNFDASLVSRAKRRSIPTDSNTFYFLQRLPLMKSSRLYPACSCGRPCRIKTDYCCVQFIFPWCKHNFSTLCYLLTACLS